MRLDARVELQWGDGSYTFALRLKEIEQLEKVCGAGIGAIVQRVSTGVYYGKDVYNVIFYGLLGGGMAPAVAQDKCKFFVEGYPLDPLDDPSSPLKTALAILQAALFGLDDIDGDEDGGTEGNAPAEVPEHSELEPRPSEPNTSSSE